MINIPIVVFIILVLMSFIGVLAIVGIILISHLNKKDYYTYFEGELHNEDDTTPTQQD